MPGGRIWASSERSCSAAAVAAALWAAFVVVAQGRDGFGFALHLELDDLLEEDALEFLEAARFQGAAFHDDFAFFCEERVVLRLVAEHGVELLVELDLDAGWEFFRQLAAEGLGLGAARRDEVDAVSVDFDDLRASGVEPVDHLLEEVAPDLGDARGGVEIGEVALREAEVAVEAVDEDFEGVLEGVEVLLLGAIARGAHGGFCFQAKLPQIGEEAAEDLELVGDGEDIELQHDAGVERGDVAMPDVAQDAGGEHGGVAALEAARHGQLGDGVALAEVFAEEEGVDAGGVAAHDDVLVVVGENARLDEVAGREEIGDGAGLAHGAEGAFLEAVVAGEVGALEFLAA